MAQQINVFLENRPGRLKAVTRLLSDYNLNIQAYVVQDHADYGMLKVLVNDPDKARTVLSETGFACALKPVLAAVVDDQPGGLYRLFDALTDANINIIDSYGFVIEAGKEAAVCVEVEDLEAAQRVASEGGFRILSPRELYDL